MMYAYYATSSEIAMSGRIYSSASVSFNCVRSHDHPSAVVRPFHWLLSVLIAAKRVSTRGMEFLGFNRKEIKGAGSTLSDNAGHHRGRSALLLT